jgi:hypothetical protein
MSLPGKASAQLRAKKVLTLDVAGKIVRRVRD